jgi:hypothetical protein
MRYVVLQLWIHDESKVKYLSNDDGIVHGPFTCDCGCEGLCDEAWSKALALQSRLGVKCVPFPLKEA